MHCVKKPTAKRAKMWLCACGGKYEWKLKMAWVKRNEGSSHRGYYTIEWITVMTERGTAVAIQSMSLFCSWCRADVFLVYKLNSFVHSLSWLSRVLCTQTAHPFRITKVNISHITFGEWCLLYCLYFYFGFFSTVDFLFLQTFSAAHTLHEK